MKLILAVSLALLIATATQLFGQALLDDKGGFLLDDMGGKLLAQATTEPPPPDPLPMPEILVTRDVLECLNAKICNGHQAEWITITPDPAIVVPAPGTPHPHVTITLTAQNSSYVTITIGKCLNNIVCDFK